MFSSTDNVVPYVSLKTCGIFTLTFLSIIINGETYAQQLYDNKYSYENINKMSSVAIKKLKKSPTWVPGWDKSLELGQVSAVSVDDEGLVYTFHRASRSWGPTTFDLTNRYRGDMQPIAEPTVMVVSSNGTAMDMWGQDMFYMPHGLTVDKEGNVWLTDVALHQVFKFTPDDHKRPAMVLGKRFIPGDDDDHFCKPSAVAVLDNGDFFVADGYCNTRVIKFDHRGHRILQFGRDTPNSRTAPPPYSLFVPHGLTLATRQELLCVADRENGRVQCFHQTNGTYHSQYRSWLIGPRLFSVAYSARDGGLLYLVNGPSPGVKVRGYVIDMSSGKLVQSFSPPGAGFLNPHDVAVSRDGRSVYVAELDPHKLHKFVEEVVLERPSVTAESGRWGAAWVGVAGGAAGGLGAVFVCAAALLAALWRGRAGRAKVRHRRRWDYAGGDFKLRRLLEPRGFQRVNTEDSDEEAPPHASMLSSAPATA